MMHGSKHEAAAISSASVPKTSEKDLTPLERELKASSTHKGVFFFWKVDTAAAECLVLLLGKEVPFTHFYSACAKLRNEVLRKQPGVPQSTAFRYLETTILHVMLWAPFGQPYHLISGADSCRVGAGR